MNDERRENPCADWCHTDGVNYPECPVHGLKMVRRDRYAAAISAADDLGIRPSDCYLEAEAAMAVADEEHDLIREAAEFHQARYVEAQDENARLRAELEATQRAKRENDERFQLEAARYRIKVERVRAVLDEWYGTSDASALSAEIRAALEGES